MPRLKIFILSAFAAMVLARAATTAKAESPKAADPESIRRWVVQLGSDDYATRDDATERLIGAGEAAFPAVIAAAKGGDLETTSRAVGVLSAWLDSSDPARRLLARDALEKLAVQPESARAASGAQMAGDILFDFDLDHQDETLDELRHLGAGVAVGNFEPGLSGDGILVVLSSDWHGAKSDLVLLARLPHLEHLSCRSVPLTDDDLPSLANIRAKHLKFVDLFGTKITVGGADTLAKAHPNAKIDRRGNALLGVGGSQFSQDCTIEVVKEGTCAEQAGIQPGDVIVKFADRPVTNFQSLTDAIAARSAGEKVIVEIHRGEETQRKEVTLGAWK